MRWDILGPGLTAALLIIAATVKLWGSDSGLAAGGVLLGGGLVLLGAATWAGLSSRPTEADEVDAVGSSDIGFGPRDDD